MRLKLKKKAQVEVADSGRHWEIIIGIVVVIALCLLLFIAIMQKTSLIGG